MSQDTYGGTSCADSGGTEEKTDMEDQEALDYAIALSLQEPTSAAPATHSASADLELVDPTPDIHELFQTFDALYFGGALAAVEVRWSPRMTLCAGVCVYHRRAGYCSIRLSKPLLQFRPRSDLVDTLLHEAIHAYLFVTQQNTDHDDHGPRFCSHMQRINQAAGTSITVYHTFHDEVDHHRTHWWQCTPPHFGIVKRSMNRPPQPADSWWARHQRTCGGTFVKIRSPTPPRPVKRPRGALQQQSTGRVADMACDIRSMFKRQRKESGGGVASDSSGGSGSGCGSSGVDASSSPVARSPIANRHAAAGE